MIFFKKQMNGKLVLSVCGRKREGCWPNKWSIITHRAILDLLHIFLIQDENTFYLKCPQVCKLRSSLGLLSMHFWDCGPSVSCLLSSRRHQYLIMRSIQQLWNISQALFHIAQLWPWALLNVECKSTISTPLFFFFLAYCLFVYDWIWISLLLKKKSEAEFKQNFFNVISKRICRHLTLMDIRDADTTKDWWLWRGVHAVYVFGFDWVTTLRRSGATFSVNYVTWETGLQITAKIQMFVQIWIIYFY